MDVEFCQRLHVCAEPGCVNTHKQDRCNTTKAQYEGWFFQKDGTAWCPEHTPEWVAEWRENRRKKDGNNRSRPVQGD